jgi:predicted DNA-binding protein
MSVKRKQPKKSDKSTFSIRLPRKTIEDFDRLAKHEGRSRNYVLCRALHEGLEKLR